MKKKSLETDTELNSTNVSMDIEKECIPSGKEDLATLDMSDVSSQ